MREHVQVEEAKERDEKISVRLPDGKEVEAVRWVTTPLNIAKGISSKLSKEVLVAKVDGKVCEGQGDGQSENTHTHAHTNLTRAVMMLLILQTLHYSFSTK